MATIPGTYVELVDCGVDNLNILCNDLVHPTIAGYQQIQINYETATMVSRRSARFTYGWWNRAFPPEVHLNGGEVPLDASLFTPDYEMGRMEFGFDLSMGDSVMATYNFSYFPFQVLKGFAERALGTINTANPSAVQSYTLKDLPVGLLGVAADLVIAMCMERLLLDYDLWKGRLIFAIGNNALYEGGGDIVGQLETVKHNAENRAYKSIDNPKLFADNTLARPTDYYYTALLTGSGLRYKNGNLSYGPLRGAKFNRLMGVVPRG